MLLLCFQAMAYKGVCIIRGESLGVELLWTVVPTIFVTGLRILKIRFVGGSPWRPHANFIKITGNQ